MTLKSKKVCGTRGQEVDGEDTKEDTGDRDEGGAVSAGPGSRGREAGDTVGPKKGRKLVWLAFGTERGLRHDCVV